MSITGHVNLITDPTAFFLPIILGTGKPPSGFVPSRDAAIVAEMTGLFLGIFPISVSANVSAVNGSFTLPDLPPVFASMDEIWINLRLHDRPFYRSEVFPRAHASKGLEIFLFQPPIPETGGVTAGQASTDLAGASLPRNTTLSADPWSLGVVGSKPGADIRFGIQIVPDTSPNLSIFFDLALDGWNIHGGWPADWCTSADDILNNIRTVLQASGPEANQIVSGTITRAIEGAPLNRSSTISRKLLDNVSIQFVTMSLSDKHTWTLSDETDKTNMIVPQLTLGFRRGF